MGAYIHRNGLHEFNQDASVFTAREMFHGLATDPKFRDAVGRVIEARRRQGYVTQIEHLQRKQLVNDPTSRAIEKNADAAKRMED